MFNYNKEYSNEEIGTGIQRIQESGCYIATIEKAILFKADKSKSEALKFTFITEDQQITKIDIFYKNKEGEEIKHNNKNLVHLVDLLKINPAALQESKDDEGNLHIPILEGKIIGLFLTYEGLEKYIGSDDKEYEKANYNLRGFFDSRSKRTIKEINDNAVCTMFDTWTRNFEKENSIREKKEDEKKKYHESNDNFKENINNVSEDTDDDGFPF